MRLIVLFLAVAGLIACAPFPELDGMGLEGATPPQLLPIDQILAQAGAPSVDPGPALASRAARLKARAAAISASPTTP
jgi:hypothetical protein